MLKVTNCLRLLGEVKYVCFNPVEFGLKSPVITIRAFGYFLSKLSRITYICVLSHSFFKIDM